MTALRSCVCVYEWPLHSFVLGILVRLFYVLAEHVIMTTCAVRSQVTIAARRSSTRSSGVPGGTILRIPLSSPKVVGIANSRGERA